MGQGYLSMASPTAEFERMVQLAAGTLPWFVTFSLATAFVMSLTASITAQTAATTTAVAVCDPVFVAEMCDGCTIIFRRPCVTTNVAYAMIVSFVERDDFICSPRETFA
jgi:hypothetical protein